MKSLKKTKKTLYTAVTLFVLTSILMTAAAAEELGTTNGESAVRFDTATIIASGTASLQTANTVQSIDVTNNTNQAPAAIPSSADNIYDVPAEEAVQQTISDEEIILNNLLVAGQAIATFTMQFDGFKYVYGSSSPKSGFDCSGLVYYVYSHFGITLPRTARAQFKNGTDVDKAALQPGDLVFFATNGGRSISHVGIFIGGSQFIHASTSRHGVMISDLDDTYWSSVLVGAKRLITPQTAIDLISQPDLVSAL